MVEQIERSDDMLFYLKMRLRRTKSRVDTEKVRLGDQIDLSFCIGLVDIISWK